MNWFFTLNSYSNVFFSREFSILALIIIAISSGMILPNKVALGADQFILPDQREFLSSFFPFFLLCSTSGQILASVITPIVRKDITCFDQNTCYPLAFIIPTFVAVLSLGMVSKWDHCLLHELLNSLKKIGIKCTILFSYFSGTRIWYKMFQDYKTRNQCSKGYSWLHDRKYCFISWQFHIIPILGIIEIMSHHDAIIPISTLSTIILYNSTIRISKLYLDSACPPYENQFQWKTRSLAWSCWREIRASAHQKHQKRIASCQTLASLLHFPCPHRPRKLGLDLSSGSHGRWHRRLLCETRSNANPPPALVYDFLSNFQHVRSSNFGQVHVRQDSVEEAEPGWFISGFGIFCLCCCRIQSRGKSSNRRTRYSNSEVYILEFFWSFSQRMRRCQRTD